MKINIEIPISPSAERRIRELRELGPIESSKFQSGDVILHHGHPFVVHSVRNAHCETSGVINVMSIHWKTGDLGALVAFPYKACKNCRIIEIDNEAAP